MTHMARIARNLLVAVLCAQPSFSLAGPGDEYDCTTARFQGSPPTNAQDEAFRRSNSSRNFRLVERGDKILAISNLPGRPTAITEYRVLPSRTVAIDVVGVENAGVGLGTIILSRQASAAGRFDATISLQGSFFANVWILHCQKRRFSAN